MAALKITGQSAEPTVTGSDAGTLYYDSDTNKLRHYNGSAWADVSPAISYGDMPSGTILQVQHTQLTTNTSQSLTAGVSTVITSLTVDITPRLTGSIIKLESYLFGELSAANTPNGSASFFYRDLTKLANTEGSPGDRIQGIGITNISYYQEDRHSTPESWTTTFFDTPTIPSTPVKITYKLGFESYEDSDFYINRSVNDGNQSYIERGCSFISATEIKG